jgi:DUF1680 family protein
MTTILKDVSLDGGFFGKYVDLITDVVIPYQEKVLNDQIEGVEKSHAIENFRLAAQTLEQGKIAGEFYGMVFQDSDVAKWLEAAAYSLQIKPDAELEQRCDAIIELIGRAQHADGYLNTYFTVKSPDLRWTNLREAHELYCAGHMIEAAVAYAECTGKTQLLDIMCRMADHMYQRFVVEQVGGFCGHPEVELALMRLYELTQNANYKQLAEYFVDTRGVDNTYFIREREKHPWDVWGNNTHNPEYLQNHRPVREQDTAVGHAVRAVYLYSGMADLAKENQDVSLLQACKTLWRNITQRRMYVTGAIGSAYEGEAFTTDYHLPNNTAYAETCASIGLIFFAQRMLKLEKHGEYADVMERALYNCVLAGMELDGTKFFYVNPLEVLPGISGEVVTHRHTKPVRPGWFTCACCPPNVARLLTSLGAYAWDREGCTVYSHLFVGSSLRLADGTVTLQTEYPYDGQLRYSFAPDAEEMRLTLAIRIPAWSSNTQILLNGQALDVPVVDGYAYIERAFSANDSLSVTLDLGIKQIYSNALVSDNSGKVAFTRGPLVYCAEGVDNQGDVLGLRVKQEANARTQYSADLGGIQQIVLDGYRIQQADTLYSYQAPTLEPCEIVLTPYYTWSNRGLNQMRVWLPFVG